MSVFMKICTGLMVSALSLSVQAAQEQNPENPGQTPSQPAGQEGTVDVANTAEVIQSLYVGNDVEVKAAELVKGKAPAEDLQQYADMLARDHSWMNKVLEVIANVKSVSLNAEELSEKVQGIQTAGMKAIEELGQKEGDEFRTAFLESAIASHQKTLELLNRIDAESTDDALKLTVSVFRQLVESHIAAAQELQSAVAQPQQPQQPAQPQQPTT